MKVTVSFGDICVVVPCGDGELLIKDLIVEATERYKRATNKLPGHQVSVQNLLTENGAYLDRYDKTKDVVEDKDCIIAMFVELAVPADKSYPETSNASLTIRDTSGISPTKHTKNITRIDTGKDVAEESDMTCESSHDYSYSEAYNENDEVSRGRSLTGMVRWCNRATLLLLRLYKQFLPLYRGSKVKKIKIWKSISKTMNEKGFIFNDSECDSKFRNMKITYKRIRDKHEGSGKAAVKWEFYTLMDELCQTSSGDAKLKVEQPQYTTDAFSDCLDDFNSNFSSTSHLATTDTTTDTESTPFNCESQFPDLLSESHTQRQVPKLAMVWSRTAIIDLLDLYDQHSAEMFSCKTTKKSVWEKIAQVMNERGHQFTEEECGNKWRNLKSTYNKIRDRYCGEGSVRTWDYYDQMHVLCSKAKVE